MLKRFSAVSLFHVVFVLCLSCLVAVSSSSAQQTLGAITCTVTDPSGAVVQDATAKATNLATNLDVTVHTNANGSYFISNVPAWTYKLGFSKEGFKNETHTEVIVNAERTTTVDGNLQVGEASAIVEVTAVSLMNEVDTTNGYVVDTKTIQDTPLGTGSFTQLAILSPGVHADFLGGSGSNSGLGNQAIFANGNRDTSNSFELNGVDTNNLFNGKSTSQVGENRFVLSTGENFGSGGTIQTSTSVYGAIGQALPTPPTDAIQEIAVNASMYDASQGNHSGAHIGVLTKSGGNDINGSVWEQYQNSDMNAAPFFYNAAGPNPATGTPLLPRPFLNRNQFGATFGGPIKKDKLFYFLSYQGVRISMRRHPQKT
jgi:Carboxypeptidase regulatory-like domain